MAGQATRLMISQGPYSILQGETIALPLEYVPIEFAGDPDARPVLEQILMAVRFLRSGAKSVQLVLRDNWGDKRFSRPYTGKRRDFHRRAQHNNEKQKGKRLREYYKHYLTLYLSRMQEPGEKLEFSTPAKANDWLPGATITITLKNKSGK